MPSDPPGGLPDGVAAGRAVAEGAVIDRDVVREPWPRHRRADRLAGLAERVGEEALAVLDRVEGPEAVDDPDLEPTAQERPVAPAPLARTRAGRRAAATRRRGRSRGPPEVVRRVAGCGPPPPSPWGRTPRNEVQQPTTTSIDASSTSAAGVPSMGPPTTTRAPSSSSCAARIPSGCPSTRSTSRPATGPSVSRARGILASTSRARASRPARAASSSIGSRPSKAAV